MLRSTLGQCGLLTAFAGIRADFLALLATFADYSGYTDCLPPCGLLARRDAISVHADRANRSMLNSPIDCQARKPLSQTAIAATLALTAILTCAAFGQLGPQFQIGAPPANESPQAAQAPAPADSAQQIEAYSLDAASRDVLLAWQKYAVGRTDIRVAVDERTAQVLVVAPAAVHGEIRQQLAGRNAAPLPGEPLANGLAAPAGPVVLQLQHIRAPEVHTRFERLLSRQLPADPDTTGEWQTFAIETSPGASVSISVNSRTGQVRLDGPPLQVAAWRKVVEALDTPPAGPGNVTQLVSTKPANQERVRKMLQALQASGGQKPVNPSLVAMLFQQENGQAAGGQPGAAGQAPPDGAAPTTQIAPGAAQTAIDAAQLAEAAGGLLGPVQVDFVEGLDVIVLRGSERDVQRVMEIINQIEQLSAVTVPEIVVHPLKHVDSLQMSALLNRIYVQVLQQRIGNVTIAPLGQPNALLLIGRAENVRMAVELIDKLDQPVAPAARFQVFPLQHAVASEVKTLIDAFLRQDEEGNPADEELDLDTPTHTPALAPRALVVADVRTNSVIVSAGPRDMAEIGELISRVDRPGATAELKVFTIMNGDATTLVEMLRGLFGTPAAADEEGAAGGGLGSGGGVRVQFSVDPRTNSIIAAGSREDLAVVEAILYRLDQGDLRNRRTTVYRLNNAFANDVATALNNWLQTERQAEVDAALGISPFEQIEREVIVVPELATNSLVISATPRFYEEVVQVVRELDERPPMVLIQVLIAEVRLNDTDQFGVELGIQDSLLFDRSLIGELTTVTTTTETQSPGGAVTTTTQDTIVNAPGNPGFIFNDPATGVPLGNNLSTNALANAGNVAAQSLSNFAVNRLDPALGFSGFVFSASSDAVSILLRALQEKRRLEVLSRPQLMALDGQPGQVQVGQDVPYVSGITLNEFGQTNNILYRSVGLILQVRPRISPDGLVVMEIFANKSEVGPESEGIPVSFSTTGVPLRSPRFEVSAAQTTVSALSGQTVILGGLIQTRKADIHRRVPIIADVPLLGNLFRYDSVSEERRELLIILTPQIIYNKLDSDLVKQIESSRMSWILSDVVNVHGEAGLRSRCDEWFEGECEDVYPTYMPQEGLLPLSGGQPLLEGMEDSNCQPQLMPPTNEELFPATRPSPVDNRPSAANSTPEATTAAYREPSPFPQQ
jgi:type II secretion system protein D